VARYSNNFSYLILICDAFNFSKLLLLYPSRFQLVEILQKAGAFTLRDPRVSEQDNDKFLDLLERYFEQPDVKIQQAWSSLECSSVGGT